MTTANETKRQRLRPVWVANADRRRARIVGEGGWALSLLLQAHDAAALRALMEVTGQSATHIIATLVAAAVKRRKLVVRTTSPDAPKSDSR